MAVNFSISSCLLYTIPGSDAFDVEDGLLWMCSVHFGGVIFGLRWFYGNLFKKSYQTFDHSM